MRREGNPQGGDMQKRLTLDGCYGTYMLDDEEPVTAALCNDLSVEGQNAGVLNIDIRVPITRASAERLIIEAHGFAWAGTAQINIDQHNVTYACFRRCVRTAGDGNLAVSTPQLPPTAMEAAACEYVRQQMSRPVDEARIKALQEGRTHDDQGRRL
jgi:hypothetical protein